MPASPAPAVPTAETVLLPAPPSSDESGSENNARFYARLPLLADFRAITETEGFVPVPPDWLVVVADVINSTDAITQGRYKDVNTVGAMFIVALLNAAPPDVELPFVFGGDGATVLIPPEMRPEARAVLRAMETFSKNEFGLRLKTGIVSTALLYQAGARLLIAKWSVSPHYVQALFAGGGLTLAEQWVKHPVSAYPLRPFFEPNAPEETNEDDYTPDFRGFYCRWATIPSPHEENVSLLVRSTAQNDEAAQRETYRAVLDEIERIYGNAANRHPIAPRQMRLAFGTSDLMTETRVKQAPQTPQARKAFLRHLRFQNAATWAFMLLKTRTPANRLCEWFHGVAHDAPPMEWDKHKTFIRDTSDCQKVDGTLRMIISGYPAQREPLTEFLERGVQEKQLVYGLHVADGALMTCLVFQPNGRQVHFVDGANGGYALASRAMKAREAASGLSPATRSGYPPPRSGKGEPAPRQPK